MKYKQIINSYIFKYLVEAIILVILIILVAIKLANNLYYSTKSGLIIEGEINREEIINSLTDIESLNIEGNTYSITNNSNKDISYKLLLCIEESDDIRINISNNSIKYLNNYSYNSGCYIIDNNTINNKSTTIYNIKLFLPKKYNNTKVIKYSLKLEE